MSYSSVPGYFKIIVLFFCQKRLNYGCHIFIISHTVERKRVIIVLLFVLHCFFVLYIKNVLFFSLHRRFWACLQVLACNTLAFTFYSCLCFLYFIYIYNLLPFFIFLFLVSCFFYVFEKIFLCPRLKGPSYIGSITMYMYTLIVACTNQLYSAKFLHLARCFRSTCFNSLFIKNNKDHTNGNNYNLLLPFK